MIRAYLKYLWESKNRHGVHSPFVYYLNESVFPPAEYYAFEKLREARKQLSLDSTKISITDYGAGSKKLGNKRSVRQILGNSVMKERYQELLFRLVVHHKSKNIIEFGTSLGLTTAYLSNALPLDGNLVSIEGCPETQLLAQKTLANYGRNNVTLIRDTFDNFINQSKKSQIGEVDFIFIDGNHTEEATKAYFDFFKENSSESVVLVFDDIHWNKEMENAWDYIKNDAKTKVTLDLFQLGIVYFDTRLSKEHFVIRA